MCGIAGFLNFGSRKVDKDDLIRMTARLAHRGPDAEGYFTEKNAGLGHRRLSVIDLSERANQPMHSRCGNYVMVYNGEAYNYKEIASELDVPMRTASDTEAVLEAYVRWGDDFVHRINGMFAIAIYSRKSGEIVLFRDRIGIKPLYYYWNGSLFAFASETKSLLALDIDKSLNAEAIKDYFFMEYIPANQSAFKHIRKLGPGEMLKIGDGGPIVRAYYRMGEQIARNPEICSEVAYIDAFEERLSRSLQYRSISDVPVGAFLSGGTDSSLVTALYQEQHDRPVQTFTVGFRSKKYDESARAAEVAGRLGTDHTLFVAEEKEGVGLAEELAGHFDEPFAAESAIATLLLCRYVRKKVKVALGGDGGDELFMGYGYYRWHDRIMRLRRFGGEGAVRLARLLLPLSGSRGERASRILSYPEPSRFWMHVWSQEQYMFTEGEISSLFGSPYRHRSTSVSWERIADSKLHPWEKIALFDMEHYLANNLLYKVDIASMAHGLEVRVPLLDHNVVEFALQLPVTLRRGRTQEKYLPKKLLCRYLPETMVYRDKWGFPAPVGEWLRGDLSFLIKKYLSKHIIDRQGLFDYPVIERLIRAFEGGKQYHYKRIWSLIVFQMWYCKYVDNLEA